MKNLSLLSLTLLVSSVAANWENYARFENFNVFFPNLVQETIYELEKYGWWNLKLNDQMNNINEAIYDRHFRGQVNYTNGFLVSLERIDLSNVMQSFLRGALTDTITGSMTGQLNFYNCVLGYDVSADLGELGVHKMTGIFRHENINFELRVQKNLNTTVITNSASLITISAGSGNIMTYFPESDIGEVLSRHYLPSSTWDGVSVWARQIITNIMLDLINQKGLPEVCFNCT